MSVSKATVFFAVFVVAQLSAHHVKVNVAVYYESLCPDSRKFITDQLYPALKNQNLSEHVDLQLVPFGKSTFTASSDDYQFKCHHGEMECVGNRIHACALRKINDTSVALSFIECLMSAIDRTSNTDQFPVKECAASRNVYNLADVENCSKHPDGKRYLADYGLMTQQLSPKLVSVPTIVFNGKYAKEDTDGAQSSFVGVLCKYIKMEHEGHQGHGVPEECASYSGASTLTIKNSVIFTAVLVVAYSLF